MCMVASGKAASVEIWVYEHRAGIVYYRVFFDDCLSALRVMIVLFINR